MKLLFLFPYPLNEAPSQRFRFEQYFNLLASLGITFHRQSFLTQRSYRLFYSSGNYARKIMALLVGFARRLSALPLAVRADYVFIHREAAPLGPPVFEWFLAKVLQKKLIFDFDDAIWMTDKTNESNIESSLRWRSKVSTLCRWSYKVSCGNEFLCAYAKRFSNQVNYNPTTIDTEKVHNKSRFPIDNRNSENIIVGWTGSHSTLKYLELLAPVFQQIVREYPLVSLLVIADRPPSFQLPNLIFRKWSEETEISDLLLSDIGVMPLPDDPWANGKCGFKALQYMALEIPTIASPVGVNSKIIEQGKTGFLANTETEWVERLRELINNEGLRKRMGAEGRKKVVREFSVASNSRNFLSLFQA